jgi:hypothetical protein
MAFSGRWAWQSTRPVIEDGLTITVHPLAKKGTHASLIWWSRGGEVFSWINYEVATYEGLDGVLTLRFKVNGESITQRISLTSRPCRFGGRRWFAICPRTGRLVTKLHTCGGAHFLSRQARGAAYASQNACPLDRLMRRRDKVLRKLKSDDVEYQPKPKGMRWRTYDRLQDELARYHDAWGVGIMRRFGLPRRTA